MFVKKGRVACATIALSLVATPAQACWSNAEQDAARIANLEQKLMVSGLRCRFGKHNFLSDYNRFISRNNALLAGQHGVLKGHYARTKGASVANAELDRFMIGLANHYGGGQGAPDCEQLQAVAERLSNAHLDTALLAKIADENAGVPGQATAACPVTIASRR